MSLYSRIENVLIVLSPLSQRFLEANMAVDAARTLKELGAKRADLTTDPRLNMQPSRHLSTYPVPDFEQAARVLSGMIFRPVLGQSDVQDMSNAVGRYYRQQPPDLFTLSNVGNLFARQSKGRNGEIIANAPDGRSLGFILYAAIHAHTPDRKPYTHLLYPDLSGHARKVLYDTLDGKCLPLHESAPYGVTVDLKATRQRIKTLISATEMPSPSKTLN